MCFRPCRATMPMRGRRAAAICRAISDPRVGLVKTRTICAPSSSARTPASRSICAMWRRCHRRGRARGRGDQERHHRGGGRRGDDDGGRQCQAGRQPRQGEGRGDQRQGHVARW
jgi:hypothetical protein